MTWLAIRAMNRVSLWAVRHPAEVQAAAIFAAIMMVWVIVKLVGMIG